MTWNSLTKLKTKRKKSELSNLLNKTIPDSIKIYRKKAIFEYNLPCIGSFHDVFVNVKTK